VLAVTDKGVYVSPDAVSYIGTAKSLAKGDGFVAVPGTPAVGHFPPLYPSVLAALDAAGIDPVDGARALNALLVGLAVVAVGTILVRATGAWWVAVAGAGLLALATDVLTYGASALSEPLFMLLALLAVAALADYVVARRPLLLAAATVFAACALLTRYVGVALVIGGVGVLIGYGRRRRWHGAVEVLAFAAGTLVPVAVWVAWASGQPGNGSEGSAVLHAFDFDYLEQMGHSVVAWFTFPSLSGWAGLAIVAGVGAVLVWALASSREGEPVGATLAPRGRALAVVAASFASAYVLVLLADRSFLDASAQAGRRLLLPLHVVAIVGLLALVRPGATGRVRIVVFSVLAALLAVRVGEAAVWFHDGVEAADGRGGFDAPSWHHSPVIDAVSDLPPSVQVYSNGADAIWFLTGRATQTLPARYDQLSGETNPAYPKQLADLAEQVRSRTAVVAYFPSIASRPFLADAAVLEPLVRLQPVVTDGLGTLYAPG
jgi:hypothetical protein